MILDLSAKIIKSPLCFNYVLWAGTMWSIENTFDLRPEDLSIKGLERLRDK